MPGFWPGIANASNTQKIISLKKRGVKPTLRVNMIYAESRLFLAESRFSGIESRSKSVESASANSAEYIDISA